jgi:hypothetical protein
LAAPVEPRSSILGHEVLPFVSGFAALIAAALAVDAVLHLLNLVWLGRYLGIPGVLLIAVSFAHSLRKRGVIQAGSPLGLLRLHERIAWAGSLLVLVHAGVHFNAWLAWLAVAAMLINVGSGLTGKYLLKRAQQRLKASRADLKAAGASEAEIQTRLHWDSLTVDVVRQWRKVHLPIALAFVVLAAAHIVAVFLYWGWH